MKKFLTVILFSLLLFPIPLISGCGGEQSARKIVIGIDDDFAPISFYNEKNELVGFDIDLAKEACERMGVAVEFKSIDWSKKREEIFSGNIDLIWNGLDVVDERKEYMIFTRPYMDDRQIFLVKKGNDLDIHSEGDLEGKIVGAQAGSTSEIYLNENEKLKNTLKEFKSYLRFKDGINSLKNKDIDVFVCDELVARYEMNTNPDQLEIVDVKTGYVTEVGIGFPKENAELRDQVQTVFDEMIKDGTAKKISEKWFDADLIKQ